MDDIKLNTFQNMCRTCMSDYDLIFIQDNNIIDILQFLSGAKYSNSDELPQKLCLKCIKTMNDIESFALKCQQTHLKLINLKNNHNTFPNIVELVKEETATKLDANIEPEFINIKQEYTDDLESETVTKDHIIPDKNPELRSQIDDRPFECNICKKSFRYSSGLIIHKRIHSGERPYKCEICNKTFTNKCNLITHKGTHSNDRQFKCETCLKSFGRLSILIQHRKIHSAERPFNCDLCCKKFTHNSYLIKHKAIHTDKRAYKCDACDKTFKVKSNLTAHKRKHNTERRFQCDLCLKRFKYSITLVRHKKLHSGIRPFHCDICSKTFSQKLHLVRHKSKHSDQCN